MSWEPDSLRRYMFGAFFSNSDHAGYARLPRSRYSVRYKGQGVGTYFADLLVEDELIVEIKCTDRLAPEHMAQCLNYLRASGKELCLLVNFQRPKVEWRRIILDAPG